jgi:hypothetical protein
MPYECPIFLFSPYERFTDSLHYEDMIIDQSGGQSGHVKESPKPDDASS